MNKTTRTSMRPYAAFGALLKHALHQSGIKHSRLAEQLGFKSPTMISHYCRGEDLPTRKALQTILSEVQRAFRRDIVDAYLNFDVPEQSLAPFQEPHEELLDQIDELIDAGCTHQALGAASLLRRETLDPILQVRLEDIIFELHIRLGEYGDAVMLADSLSGSTGLPAVVMEIRAYGMRGIALRAAGFARLQAAYANLVNAQSLIRSNRGALSRLRPYRQEYADVIDRELCLVKLDGLSKEHLNEFARTSIPQLHRRVESATSQLGSLLFLEAAGRCHLAIDDPGGVEDILEELVPKCSAQTRTLEERCLILRGRTYHLESKNSRLDTMTGLGYRDRAGTNLRLAYRIAMSNENIHHARVAQVALSALTNYAFAA